MAEIPSLTEQEIRAQVGGRSFELGAAYAKAGAVFRARRQGDTLKANCRGTQADFYRVEAIFDERGLQGADCSCPVGSGGQCKHVAALLLTWRRHPDQFHEVEHLEAALERRSKEELIAVIRQMLRQEPELESVLETPLPTRAKRRAPVSADTYRRQAAAAFRHGDYGWGAVAGIISDLRAVVAIGEGFFEREDYPAAAAVFQGVAVEVFEGFEEVDDESGELIGVVNECVSGLGECLARETGDAEVRSAMVESLFDLFRRDVELGGFGASDPVPDILVDHATPEERRMVARWAREAIPEAGDWARQAYGGLLIDLEEHELDDEAFIQLCRETGRQSELVHRLLFLGRVEEAVREATSAGDYQLLRHADQFVALEYGDVAERLVRDRIARSKSTQLLEWLKRRHKQREEWQEALALAEEMFRLRPGLDGYRELRELGKRLECWETLGPPLRAVIDAPEHFYLRVQVHLDEGEIDAAIQAIQSPPKTPYGVYWHADLNLAVAQAAEDTRPEQALVIYRKHAEGLIVQRGRGSYQIACDYLKKVRALYDRLGEGDEWTRYVADLRERNRSLRALREELLNAGLM